MIVQTWTPPVPLADHIRECHEQHSYYDGLAPPELSCRAARFRFYDGRWWRELR